MNWSRGLLLTALGIVSFSSPASGQLRPRRDASLPRAGTGRRLPDERGANRAQLERQFRQKLYEMTRQRVGLTDAQMKQLVPVNQRFETRLALRDAMRDSAGTDQSRISGYLDKLMQLQRQRIDLLEQEQRDLAQFMTPLQRARYTALQEQVRRRIDQMLRQRRAQSDSVAVERPPNQH